MGGGTKAGEIERSCDLFEQICAEQEPYFAVSILYDMQYGREEMKMMMDCWEARMKRAREAKALNLAKGEK